MKTLKRFLTAIPELVAVMMALHETVEAILQLLDKHFARTLALVEDVVSLKGRLAEWEAETEALVLRADEKFKAARRRENSVSQREKALGNFDDSDPQGPAVAPEDRGNGQLPLMPPGSEGGNRGPEEDSSKQAALDLYAISRRENFGG